MPAIMWLYALEPPALATLALREVGEYAGEFWLRLCGLGPRALLAIMLAVGL